MKAKDRGFTLVELAIALVVTTLILSGISVPINQRLIEQQYTDTQQSIDKAMEALVGFALLNGRLPCPDISTTVADNRDGAEKTATPTGTCVAGANTTLGVGRYDYTNAYDWEGVSWGDLPWRTLGLAPPHNADAWNNRLRYAVVSRLAEPAKPAGSQDDSLRASLGTNIPHLDIRCTNPATAVTTGKGPRPPIGCIPTASAASTYLVSNQAAFVVYSVGANGWGSTNINDLSRNKPFTAAQLALSPDQAVNAPETKAGAANLALRRQFVMRDRASASSNTLEFDDVVSFMPSARLASILLHANQWP